MAESTVTFVANDAQGTLRYFNAEQNGNAPPGLSPHQVIELNGSLLGPTNALPTTHGAITPHGGNAWIVETAGTPIVAVEANANGIGGGLIINVGTTGAFIDIVNNAGTVSPGPQGTTLPFINNGTATLPSGLTTAVTLNAPDDNHPFVVVVW